MGALEWFRTERRREKIDMAVAGFSIPGVRVRESAQGAENNPGL